MSNSNFDKYGLEGLGFHWLQWTAIFINCFSIWFGRTFFNNHNVNRLVRKIFKSLNCN